MNFVLILFAFVLKLYSCEIFVDKELKNSEMYSNNVDGLRTYKIYTSQQSSYFWYQCRNEMFSKFIL